MKSLLNNIKIERCLRDTAPGQTDIITDSVDSGSFTGVLFLVFLGALPAGATVSVSVQGYDEKTTNTYDYKESEISVATTADSSGYMLAVEVYLPECKSNRLVIKRSGQDIGVNGAVALLYSGRKAPVKQLFDSLQLVSPDKI